MTTFTRRSLRLLLISFSSLLTTPAVAQLREVPMTADHWTALSGKPEFKEHNGKAAIVLAQEGRVTLNDLLFTDGTVEFDVEPKGGSGLGFRVQDMTSLELLYLRTQPGCATRPDCVQYAPLTRGVLLWDVFPQYQGPAPVRENEWNHVKIVVSGRRMNLFVNGSTTPTLAVGSLEGDTKEGRLALFGPGAFANFSVRTNAVEGLDPVAAPDPTAGDPRMVRQWRLSPASDLPDGKEPSIAEMPKSTAGWRALTAERGGLVNISRVYGLPAQRPLRSVTWLTTTISSKTSQSKTVAIGWTREVWVFVNGQPVHADKNLYQPPAARKTPDGRLSLDNGSFVLPLKAGDNDVAIALANNFYGWGLMLRLENLEGIELGRR